MSEPRLLSVQRGRGRWLGLPKEHHRIGSWLDQHGDGIGLLPLIFALHRTVPQKRAQHIARLLEQARSLRQLAKQISLKPDARRMAEMAEECEAKAVALQRAMVQEPEVRANRPARPNPVKRLLGLLSWRWDPELSRSARNH
jgi:hypothetical protein